MSSTSPHKPSEYHRMIAEALDDEFLRRTLDKFAVEYRASRDKVFTEVDGADLIRRIADRKDWAARHLEELYEQFKTEAKSEGYILNAFSYTKKEKKSKGEIVDDGYLIKVAKVYGGFWDGLE